MSKKREAPPKPEELIQKLSEKLEVVKGELTVGLEETKSQVGEKRCQCFVCKWYKINCNAHILFKTIHMHTYFFLTIPNLWVLGTFNSIHLKAKPFGLLFGLPF